MTLNFRAILAGVVIDLVGLIIASAVFVTIFVGSLTAKGASDDEIRALLANPADSASLMFILLMIGIFFDGVAGYVTARRAGYLEYWHVLAMLGLLIVIQLAMSGGPTLPVLVQAVSYIGGGAAAFFGAWLVKRKRISGG
jgi:hypothetical protein